MAQKSLPTLAEVRTQLRRMNEAGLRALSEKSGVAFPTLTRIKYGTKDEPLFSTVGAFFPHIEGLVRITAHQSRDYRRELLGLESKSPEKAEA